ncbi:MAG: alpha/beta hydrolase [Phycisphaerae bacterium]|nr:alpha/beta hydrolase [Phycisphaerae bacterium]
MPPATETVTRILDSPEFNRRLFLPPLYDGATPPGAQDVLVPVADGIRVHGRVYACPTPRVRVLLFHGNGEDVDSYVRMAARLAVRGAALTVFGYRGYALSDGEPSLRAALEDSHVILKHLRTNVWDGSRNPVVVMGRSLGSAPAIELAAGEPGLAGLILESGYADPYRLVQRRGFAVPTLSEDELTVFSNCRKMKHVRAPLLVLHGREDELIHPDEAAMNYEAAGSTQKRLVLLDGAGHNDIGIHAQYYPTLERFLAECSA